MNSAGFKQRHFETNLTRQRAPRPDCPVDGKVHRIEQTTSTVVEGYTTSKPEDALDQSIQSRTERPELGRRFFNYFLASFPLCMYLPWPYSHSELQCQSLEAGDPFSEARKGFCRCRE